MSYNATLRLARRAQPVQEYEMRNPNPRGAMFEAQQASDQRNYSIEARKARQMMAARPTLQRPGGGSAGSQPRPTGRGAGRMLPRAARR